MHVFSRLIREDSAYTPVSFSFFLPELQASSVEPSLCPQFVSPGCASASDCSGKEKAHKHKQIFPVTARVGGGLPTGWPGVSRLVARGQKFMCCVRNPRNINIFVRVPGWEDRVPGREDRWDDREIVYVPYVYVPFSGP